MVIKSKNGKSTYFFPSHMFTFHSLVQFLLPTVKLKGVRLPLHGAIYRPDSFVLMLYYCANLKAIRYESTTLKRIVADKSSV